MRPGRTLFPAADFVKIVRERPERGWTAVPNSTVRDRRLSWKARGVLVYLLSHEDGWSCDSADLARESPGGREQVQSALRELIACGYMSRARRQDLATGRWSTVTRVFDLPQADADWHTGDGFSDAGSPGSRVSKRLPEDQPHREKTKQAGTALRRRPARTTPAELPACLQGLRQQLGARGLVARWDRAGAPTLARFEELVESRGAGAMVEAAARAAQAYGAPLYVTAWTSVWEALPERAQRRRTAGPRCVVPGHEHYDRRADGQCPGCLVDRKAASA